MKDVQKIKEFFSKPLKETKEEDVLGDWISDMLKYKSYEEVKKIVAKSLRDALLDDELVAKIKKEKSSMNEAQSLTGGYPHKKTSGAGFEKIEITEPMDDATKSRMIKNFRAAGWDAKPNNGGGITAVKKTMMEAKKEDAVDTITMDIPLFLRMLEYSREDAQKDLDLHDVKIGRAHV